MKEKMLKGILVNVESNTVDVVEIENDLDTLYDVLNCRTIDIVTRKIGKKYYDIICDDEGLLINNPKISAIDDLGQPQLVGNLLIVKNKDYDIGSLNDKDVEYIMNYIQTMYTTQFPEGYKMLTQVGF